jgi:putative membrane protein
MALARVLLISHGAAVVFALLGLLVAIPNPELWSHSDLAARIYPVAMEYAGSIHIVLGAAAMLAYGGAVLGWRNTLLFFAISTSLSLGIELLGTGTGWPFGAYEYTSGLGPMILERVPISIPLSWFMLGLSSYLLALLLLARFAPRAPAWAGVALGAWLLTVWDLALDPAMAHADMPLRFWVWHQTGPYLGMPLVNFAGWTLTGILFMGLGRAVWRGPLDPERLPPGIPFAVYAINTGFAVVLNASLGLWLPIVLAIGLGVVPAGAVWAGPRTRRLADAPT